MVLSYESSSVVQPRVVVVEVALALVECLVGQVVELKDEGKIGETTQLHLGRF